MAEKRVLVEHFSQLRQMDIVWYVGCGFCGSEHRTYLAKLLTGGHEGINAMTGDRQVVDRLWLCGVRWKCCPTRDAVIGPDSVVARKIYRVELGLETGQTTTRKRELVDAGPRREER